MTALCAGPCTRCEMICMDQRTGLKMGPEPLLTLASFRRRHGRIFFGILLTHQPTPAQDAKPDDKGLHPCADSQPAAMTPDSCDKASSGRSAHIYRGSEALQTDEPARHAVASMVDGNHCREELLVKAFSFPVLCTGMRLST